MTESVENKGHRLVMEGRVRTIKATENEYWSVVLGDNSEYIVVCLPGRGFTCECPSTVPCSHIAAGQEAWLIAMGGAQ